MLKGIAFSSLWNYWRVSTFCDLCTKEGYNSSADLKFKKNGTPLYGYATWTENM
nr:hypothetical protein [Mycoplasmopsis bovis]QQH18748.1 hypothetical protein HYE49_00855 [Mycoplasmopsis bovis]